MPRRKLPPILKKRIRDDATEAERIVVFNALVTHYRLADRFTELMKEPAGDQKQVLATMFWSDLAMQLLFDWIPAYYLMPPGRRKGANSSSLDWIDAGGSFLLQPKDIEAFYQAQFVELIAKRVAETRRSRNWVFQWFANEQAVAGNKEAMLRRQMLPRPFRNRATSQSLRQAFNSIPKAVRQNPRAYLPQPPTVVPLYSRSRQTFLGGG